MVEGGHFCAPLAESIKKTDTQSTAFFKTPSERSKNYEKRMTLYSEGTLLRCPMDNLLMVLGHKEYKLSGTIFYDLIRLSDCYISWAICEDVHGYAELVSEA